MPSSTLPKRVRVMLAEESLGGRMRSVRGHKVMIDSDLSEVYGVTVKRLNEQVRRNRRRFPADLTADDQPKRRDVRLTPGASTRLVKILVIGEEIGCRHEAVSHAMVTIDRLGRDTELAPPALTV